MNYRTFNSLDEIISCPNTIRNELIQISNYIDLNNCSDENIKQLAKGLFSKSSFYLYYYLEFLDSIILNTDFQDELIKLFKLSKHKGCLRKIIDQISHVNTNKLSEIIQWVLENYKKYPYEIVIYSISQITTELFNERIENSLLELFNSDQDPFIIRALALSNNKLTLDTLFEFYQSTDFGNKISLINAFLKNNKELTRLKKFETDEMLLKIIENRIILNIKARRKINLNKEELIQSTLF